MNHAEIDASLAAKQAEFTAARGLLEMALGLVVGEFTEGFPDGSHYTSGHRDGMSRLGSRIEDLAAAYDRFQASLGLSEGDRTRFATFFTGRQGVYMDPPPWHDGQVGQK